MLFWPAFLRIRTEFGEIFRISSYSDEMRENTDQNNSEYGQFLHSEKLCYRSIEPLELTSVKYCFLGIFGNLKYSLLSVLSGSGHHTLCKICENTGLDFVIIFVYIGWIWYLKNSVAERCDNVRHWIRRCISMAVFSRYFLCSSYCTKNKVFC